MLKIQYLAFIKASLRDKALGGCLYEHLRHRGKSIEQVLSSRPESAARQLCI
ncbi:MAG: hypothetical protein LBB21_02360 [Holosporaceae bacterium]|nr:hypothetical protein [Holosporaceae bacterium]